VVYKFDLESDSIEYVSPASQLVLGLAPQDLALAGRRGLFSLVHPEDRDRAQRIWSTLTDAVSQGADSTTMEYRWLCPDGHTVWISNRISLQQGKQGSSVVGTMRDVSELKAAAASLEEAVRQLAESNAELERFAYVASHDLHEPLRTISGYVQLMERKFTNDLDDEGKQFLGFVRAATQRMHDLIQDLLSYSRISTGGRATGDVSLDAVVADVKENLELPIRQSGACVRVGELPTVRGDLVQMTQLLQNLMSNALKFHDGNETPMVDVYCDRRADEWVISVQDNGIGIDPECHDLIFEAYKRLHGQEKFPGTGMGLAICRKIVERHGGRIWVESSPGDGTCFRFTLPFEPFTS
jgi:PAS domain S-box-containing protein